MTAIAFALCFIGSIAGAVFLIIHGHPYFAGAVLVIAASLEMHGSADGK